VKAALQGEVEPHQDAAQAAPASRREAIRSLARLLAVETA
jgi:hypothetical protein